jgi:hypothetical protein
LGVDGSAKALKSFDTYLEEIMAKVLAGEDISNEQTYGEYLTTQYSGLESKANDTLTDMLLHGLGSGGNSSIDDITRAIEMSETIDDPNDGNGIRHSYGIKRATLDATMHDIWNNDDWYEVCWNYEGQKQSVAVPTVDSD